MFSHVRFLAAAVVVVALSLMGRPSDVAAQSYILKPGDVVEITVIEDPGLNRRMLIGPDGNVAMPLAGTIDAGGRTLTDLQDFVRGRLRRHFVSPPSVTASLVSLGPGNISIQGEEGIEEAQTGSFYILGEVQRPGKYDFDSEEPLDILKVLALAGGPSTFAATRRIQIREPGENGETIRLFDYDAIEDGDAVGDASATIVNGTIIVVPERGLFE